jgi:hypothetical protein
VHRRSRFPAPPIELDDECELPSAGSCNQRPLSESAVTCAENGEHRPEEQTHDNKRDRQSSERLMCREQQCAKNGGTEECDLPDATSEIVQPTCQSQVFALWYHASDCLGRIDSSDA